MLLRSCLCLQDAVVMLCWATLQHLESDAPYTKVALQQKMTGLHNTSLFYLNIMSRLWTLKCIICFSRPSKLLFETHPLDQCIKTQCWKNGRFHRHGSAEVQNGKSSAALSKFLIGLGPTNALPRLRKAKTILKFALESYCFIDNIFWLDILAFLTFLMKEKQETIGSKRWMC